MKKAFFVAIIMVFTLLTSTYCVGQPVAAPEELAKHDLKWIKTNGDFDQTSLDETTIENEINRRIQNAIKNNKLTADIQVPINTKKLKYLEHKHPREFGFGEMGSGLEHLNKEVYMYQYDDFYISTEEDQAVDQNNVFYTIRAVNILRIRYPESFKELFIDSKNPVSEKPRFQTFVNSNKGFWIAFNENPKFVSSNNTIFLFDRNVPNSDIELYRNISVVNIHSKNILGASPSGSGPVYKQTNPWDNYNLHMADGLIVSIVHEMLHNYIDYAYVDKERFHLIKSYRGCISTTNFNLAEENAIINTSYSYFRAKGGIKEQQINYYYNNVYNPNIKTLRSNNQLNYYCKAFSDITVTSSTNLNSIFLIPVLKIQQQNRQGQKQPTQPLEPHREVRE